MCIRDRLCTPLLEVFRIAKGRGATSCRKLLGRVFKGTLVTDRYSVYARFASKQQYCHSHLYRDWLKVEQRGGEDEEIGRQLRRLTRRLLRAHRRKRREGLTQEWLRKQLAPIQRSYAEWLVHGFEHGSAKTRANQISACTSENTSSLPFSRSSNGLETRSRQSSAMPGMERSFGPSPRTRP